MFTIPRTLFDEDHDAFRDSVRRFLESEVAPFHDRWEEQGHVDRQIWNKAGANGFLCPTMPEAYGGAGGGQALLGGGDGRGRAHQRHGHGLGPALRDRRALHQPLRQRAQKQTWLPRMARGEIIGAIAMTDPACGLRPAVDPHHGHPRRRPLPAQRLEDLHHQRPQQSDLVIVVCKTDPTKGAKGTSLLLVEADAPASPRASG
jgi:alkylation response protein AidB-like acyl-CoA dehydrogenase